MRWVDGITDSMEMSLYKYRALTDCATGVLGDEFE